MTNAERQGKDILAQECKTGGWGVNKYTMEIMPCGVHFCPDCLFEGFPDANICKTRKVYWLNAENKPKREFSEEDKAVVRALDKAEWLARDEDGTVYAYMSKLKPEKKNTCWKTDKMCFSLTGFTSAKFLPISWDDDEPTSREEILGEE